MFPRSTKYRLATSPNDYKACRALFAENHGADPDHSLTFPTVLAERNGEVVGFLSTWDDKKALIAGPLEVKGGKNIFTFIRLIEAYENVMRSAGVTQFLFCTKVARGDSFDPERIKEYERFGVKFLRFDQHQAMFLKEIRHG